MKRFLFFLIVSFCVASCGTLTYVPVETPINKGIERQLQIEQQLRIDFATRKLHYSSVAFGKKTVIKPKSHFVLDSLYAKKYELEKKYIVDRNIENQIKTQQLIVYNDTTQIYFLEKHVFGIVDSINLDYTVYYAELYVNRENKIETIQIVQSDKIDSTFKKFYANFMLKNSFIYSGGEADVAELEFYKLYEMKLNSLEGFDREEFLKFMLNVMKTANRYSNIDKQFLIKEYVRKYIQGDSRNMYGEQFAKMEEFFNEKNELIYYYIDYACNLKNEEGELYLQKFDIYLDPYLQPIDIKKK